MASARLAEGGTCGDMENDALYIQQVQSFDATDYGQNLSVDYIKFKVNFNFLRVDVAGHVLATAGSCLSKPRKSAYA